MTTIGSLDTEKLNALGVAPAYKQLFEIDPKVLEELKKKSIDVLFSDYAISEMRMKVKNRKIYSELVKIEQGVQQQKVNDKISEYNRYSPIVCSAIAGAGSVIAACMGQGLVGNIFSAASHAVEATGKHFDSRSQGVQTSLDHVYQTQSSLAQQHRQEELEQNREIDRLLSQMQAIEQATQRAFDSAASAA